MKWEGMYQHKINWTNIMQVDNFHVMFLVQVVYDTLPIKAHLNIFSAADPKA